MATETVTNENQSTAVATTTSSSSTKVLGNTDKRLSDTRKVWIADEEITIVGVYGQGTTFDVTSNWTAAMEGMTPGNKYQAVGSFLQYKTGKTLIKSINSQLIWQGNDSTRFNLELILYALRDADAEVMQPLHALEYMIAPDLHSLSDSITGEIAKAVQINIGTKVIYQNLCITSMSFPFDKEVDSQGNYVRCTVNLGIATLQVMPKDLLRAGIGIKSSLTF